MNLTNELHTGVPFYQLSLTNVQSEAHYFLSINLNLRSLETVNTDRNQASPETKSSLQHLLGKDLSEKYRLVPYRKKTPLSQKGLATQETSSGETLTSQGSSNRALLKELVQLVEQHSRCNWREGGYLPEESGSEDGTFTETTSDGESSISLIDYPEEGGETPPCNPPSSEEGYFTSPFSPHDFSTQLGVDSLEF
uniref:ORF3 n=1 Tax=Torque teno Arctocephalus gazella virus 2 TaxID=2249933 RepID=A0A2Z4N3H0_9VIRU|nr:ORF3 [Torque teno Arctocephalus gazella virus 2]